MTTCIDGLGDDRAVLCHFSHCAEFADTAAFRSICNCMDWQGRLIPNCLPRDSQFPVATSQCVDAKGNLLDPPPPSPRACFEAGGTVQSCFCCCACFASTTPVAAPNGMRPVSDFSIGDSILAAARTSAGWSWSPRTIQFSSGTPAGLAGRGNIMVSIAFGDGKELIATPNQLFVMAGSGKLKRAEQLTPGTRVGLRKGETVPILAVAIGEFSGGVHHIAADVPTSRVHRRPGASTDQCQWDHCRRLCPAIYQTTDKMKPNMAPLSPVIGTKKTPRNIPTCAPATSAAGPSAGGANLYAGAALRRLYPLDQRRCGRCRQPAAARSRAPDRPGGAEARRVGSRQPGHRGVLHGLFSAFYPDIRFLKDWVNMRPTSLPLPSWRKDRPDQRRFLRLGPLFDCAMAAAFAFGVAT